MPERPVVALVPLRSPGAGKTRLRAAGLTETQRAQLSAAMFADVVAALRASSIDRIVVAAKGAAAEVTARAVGLTVHPDPPRAGSLDEAIAATAATLDAAGSLLVVMADLPRLGPEDVDEVIGTEAAVVVAATDDGGTGALMRRPPNVMGTAYGTGSADRHVLRAEAAGLTVRRITTPGFSSDVDTIDDLRQLGELRLGEATRRVLNEVLPDPERAR